MTLKSLELALIVMKSTSDKAIRLGYNSPGALASVNHLHLHLLHVERELYVEVVVSSQAGISSKVFLAGTLFLETGKHRK